MTNDQYAALCAQEFVNSLPAAERTAHRDSAYARLHFPGADNATLSRHYMAECAGAFLQSMTDGQRAAHRARAKKLTAGSVTPPLHRAGAEQQVGKDHGECLSEDFAPLDTETDANADAEAGHVQTGGAEVAGHLARPASVVESDADRKRMAAIARLADTYDLDVEFWVHHLKTGTSVTAVELLAIDNVNRVAAVNREADRLAQLGREKVEGALAEFNAPMKRTV